MEPRGPARGVHSNRGVKYHVWPEGCVAAKSPLGLPWLPLESIAPAVVFMASDDASMVSGAAYDVTEGTANNTA